MKRLLFTFVIIFFLLLPVFFPSSAQAAKKLVRKKAVTKKTTAVVSSLPSKVSYRGDKHGIFLTFSNFSGIESVAYSFTYATHGVPQGAGGNITASNNPTSQRELLFGTCSTSACTYHGGLTNARLILTAKYTNGKTATKAYRIKTYY